MNITLDLQILTDSAVITRAFHNFVSEVEMATLLDVPSNLTPLSPSPHIWVHPCFLRTEVPGPSSVLFLQMWESIILKVALVPFSRKWHETPTSEPREGTVDGVTSEQNKLPFLKGYRFMLIFSIYLSIYGAHPRACSFLLLIRLAGLCPLPWTHCYRASHQKGLNYCDAKNCARLHFLVSVWPVGQAPRTELQSVKSRQPPVITSQASTERKWNSILFRAQGIEKNFWSYGKERKTTDTAPLNSSFSWAVISLLVCYLMWVGVHSRFF